MLSKWFNGANVRQLIPTDRVNAVAETVLDTLRESGTTLAKQRDAGLEFARGISSEVLASSQRAGRSARQLVQQRPAETVVLVAATAFAIGWLVRRLRERNAEASSAPARVSRRVPAKSAPASSSRARARPNGRAAQ